MNLQHKDNLSSPSSIFSFGVGGGGDKKVCKLDLMLALTAAKLGLLLGVCLILETFYAE